MKRFIYPLLIILAIAACYTYVHAQHDVDTTKTLAQASRSELFRVIYNVPQSIVDSARVWYSHHSGQDTTVSEDVLFDELMSRGAESLRSWELKYKTANQSVPTTF